MKRDKLIDNYMPTHSGWFFHPENMVRLHGVEKDGKVHIQESLDMDTYRQLMFSTSGDDARVYYLDIIANEGGLLPEIITDLNASNARSLKLPPNTYMIFKTAHPYNPDRLYKLQVRARVENGGTLYSGLIGLRDEAYWDSNGGYGVDDFYPVVHDVLHQPGASYKTDIGYVLGLGTSDLAVSASLDPDYPKKLYTGTTDVAMVMKTGDTGMCYVDSIELLQMDNDITEIPGGKLSKQRLSVYTTPPSVTYSRRTGYSADYVYIYATVIGIEPEDITWECKHNNTTLTPEQQNIPLLPVPSEVEGEYEEFARMFDTAGLPEGTITVKLTANSNLGVGNELIAVTTVYINVVSDETAMYIGASISPPAVSGTEILEGDYYLNATTNIPYHLIVPEEGEPYWEKVTADMDNYSTIVSDVLADALKHPDTLDSTSALWGYFGNLGAVNAFIENLMAQDLKIENSGQIRQNYTKSGELEDENIPGFYLGQGLLKANHASLVGSLKTGHNAPGGARISATDTAGFTAPVQFNGTGLNDMIVYKEGVLQTGDWTVKVTQTNLKDISDFVAVPWRAISTISSSTWTGVAQYDGVWIAVNASGQIIRSVNNGASWTTATTAANGWSSVTVHKGTWVVVGTNKWSKSTDGGVTWSTPANISSSDEGYLGIAINDVAWVAVGRTGDQYNRHGYIAVSTNNGVSWSLKSSTGTTLFRSVAVEGNTFIAVGHAGNGVSGSQAISNDNGASWSISNSYARRFYAVTVSDGVWGRVSDGVNNFYEIARSTNNGASWSTQTVSYTSGTTSWYEDIIAHGSLWLLIGSNGALRVSFDSGVSWSAVYTLGSGYWSSGCISDYGIVIGGRTGIMSGKVLLNAIYDTIATKMDNGTYGPDIPLYPKRAITVAGDTNIGFSSINGHIVGDTWTFTKTALSALKLTDRFGYTYFDAIGGEVIMRNYRFLAHVDTVVFTRSNNQIYAEDIVQVLALEEGDVIRVAGSASNNNMYTVEAIWDNNTITVNYEHRNGSGPLSLVNETIKCTIELIAKWHSAPIGLGQAWVNVTNSRYTGAVNTNTTKRPMACSIRAYKAGTATAYVYVTVDGISMLSTNEDHQNQRTGSSYPTTFFIYNNTYVITSWENKDGAFELR